MIQACIQTDDPYLWPSMSVGAQQSSLVSYGTAWDLRAAPCSSEATVTINPHKWERAFPEGRKRPFPQAQLAVSCHMLTNLHCLTRTVLTVMQV